MSGTSLSALRGQARLVCRIEHIDEPPEHALAFVCELCAVGKRSPVR